MILRAKYIIPVDAPPVRHGAIRVLRQRIAAIGHANVVDPAPGDAVIDFGDAAICPGFVNAHTHLELSALAGLVPPGTDFIGWLNRLRELRDACFRDERVLADSVRAGVQASLAAGVTTIGDITSRPDVVRPLLKHGPQNVVSYGEVIAIGAARDKLKQRLHAAIDGADASDTLTIAVSPHAPYTVEPDGIRACAQTADELKMPLCMHLAETRDEVQYTETGRGPFCTFLQALGLLDDTVPCPALHPIDLADSCGVLGPRSLIAHANYVTDAHIELLARRGASVAYCPRTHAAFEHEPHRFLDMLRAGVNVCVATDSLASTPSLSPLDELRFLRSRFPDIAGDSLMAMATIAGAKALGLDDHIGSLRRGSFADMVIIPLSPNGPRNPVDNILLSTLPPIETYIRGQRVHGPRL